VQSLREAGLHQETERGIVLPAGQRFERLDEMLDNAGHGIGVKRETEQDTFRPGKGLHHLVRSLSGG
jgi:hypothetical protein